MNILDIYKIKNDDYIVLLPRCDEDIKESVAGSFKNVFFMDYDLTEEHAKALLEFINKRKNNLLLFDFDDFYRIVLPFVKKQTKVKWVYKNNLALLTDWCIRPTFSVIMEFYDRNMIETIGCLDKSTHLVLKNAGYRSKYIQLDVKRTSQKSKKHNSIGILGKDYAPNHNIYNELSAVKLVDYDYVKILKEMPATKHFIDFFGIKEKEVEGLDEIMKDNFVNLYCNFASDNAGIVLKSLDMGVPCILGNTDLFDRFPKLKKYLVLQSDDDIGEIAEKINGVRENYEKIMTEYEKFRKKYSEESRKSIEEFLR
ncbi:MAG: hypothetical protein Q4B34_00485 [Candidatus Saccharibacteria bacterium]|nr:hypothetical protein [Candidatus Saccharibacteria bacterium]